MAEGPQAVREAVGAGLAVHVLATTEAAQRHPDLVAGGWWRIDDAALRDLAETVHPAGVVAVCRWEPAALGALLAAQPRFFVVGASMRDPGNAGTVIRCADAFGADAVVLTTGSVDPTNSKTVRASAGSLFHLPVACRVDLADALADLRAAGLTILAADGQGPQDLADLAQKGELERPVAWLFGNEAWGLPAAETLADEVVRIPMWGRAESLNLATAAAVCLYATAVAQFGRPSRTT